MTKVGYQWGARNNSGANMKQPRSQRILKRALALSAGQFSLVLMRCNYGSMQGAWIEQLPSDEPLWEGLHWVQVLSEVKDLLPSLEASTSAGNPTAVMVLGLGQVNDLGAVLTVANQLRDRFKSLPCPVVMWLSDGALEQFARSAPDLKSWAATPIAVEVSPKQLLTFLDARTAMVFQQMLRVAGGDSLELPVGELPVSPQVYRELVEAKQELAEVKMLCPPRLEAALAFALGVEAYGRGAITVAQGLFETSARFWKGVLSMEEGAVLRYCVAQYWVSRCCCGSNLQTVGKREKQGWQRARMGLAEALTTVQNRNSLGSQAVWEEGVYRFLVGPLGECLMALREWDALERLTQDALVRHQRQGQGLAIARDYRLLGEVALGRSRWTQAEGLLRRALGRLAQSLFGETLPMSLWPTQVLNQQSQGTWLLPSEVAIRRGIYLWRLGAALWRSRQGALAIKTLVSARQVLNAHGGCEEPMLAVLTLLQEIYFSQGRYLNAFRMKQDLRLAQHRFGRLAFVGAEQLQPAPPDSIDGMDGGSEGAEDGIAPELRVSGRSQDVTRLIQRLGRNDRPMTVIHGESGVGKSSLIRAGLVPELQRKTVGDREAVPVIVDRYTDWVTALALALDTATPLSSGRSPLGTLGNPGAIARPSALLKSLLPSTLLADAVTVAATKVRRSEGAIATSPPSIPLIDRGLQWEDLSLTPGASTQEGGLNGGLAKTLLGQVLARLRHNADRQYLTVLIFDQFEEFFLTWPRPEDRRLCFEFLRDCLNLPYVKLIFSVREDYLYFLLDWERSTILDAVENNVLDREVRYGIGQFSPEDAIATVNSLMARSQFALEPALIEALVQDLAAESGQVNPIELQVVGAQLQVDGVTTLATYQEQYGSKNQVVERYLQNTIHDCGPQSEAIAWQVLFLLTAENGTRPLKNRSELETEIGVAGRQLDTVLQILEGAGLIMVFRDRAGWLYQLVHDYLISYIRQQREAAEQAKFRLTQSQFRLTQSQLNRVLRKRVRELYGAGAVLLMLLMSSTGFALMGASGKTEAQVRAQTASAEFVMDSGNQPFEALERTMGAWRTFRERQWSLVGNPSAQARSELHLATTLSQALVRIREFNRLESHMDIVWSVAHSPTGQYFASASTDRTVRLWHDNGQPVLDPQGEPWVWRQKASASDVTFDPSGQVLAIAGGRDNPVVHLVNLQGEVIAVLKGHQDAVYSVAYSPDGRLIATASADGTVRLWTAEGQLIREILGHTDAVEGVTFSPNGQILATASDDKTVRLWSLEGRELQRLTGHTELVFSLDFSPDGKLLASGSYDHTIKLWTIGDNNLAIAAEPLTLQSHSDRIFGVSFSPDGQTLASTSEDKTIKIWSRDGKLLQTLPGHTDRVTGVAFSPEGQWLISSSYDTTVRLWQLQPPIQNRQTHRDRIYGMAISPNSQWIATGSVDGELKLLHRGGALARILSPIGNPVTQGIHDVMFDPSGEIIAVVGRQSGVRFWTLAGDRTLTFGQRFDDNNNKIASTSVSFDPQAERLAIAYEDGEIHLWTANGQRLQTLSFPPADVDNIPSSLKDDHSINRVVFSPDGQHIAAASSDRNIYLWDRNGTFLRKFTGHTNYVSDITFSPDGQRLASAGGDKLAYLWTLNGDRLHALPHIDAVIRVQFHPSGEFLVSGSWDGLITLWDRHGTPIKPIKDHSDGIGSVQFSPDGEWLNSAGYDETVIFRHLNLSDLVDRSCFWLKDYIEIHGDRDHHLNRTCGTGDR